MNKLALGALLAMSMTNPLPQYGENGLFFPKEIKGSKRRASAKKKAARRNEKKGRKAARGAK